MSAGGLASAIFGTWFEASADGAFAIDRTTERLVCANARFAEMLGRETTSLQGTPFGELLLENTAPSELLGTFGHRDHVAFLHAGGGLSFLTLAIAPMSHLGAGELVACLARDTSAARRLELESLTSHEQLHAAHGDLAQLVDQLSRAKLQLEERNREIAVLAGQVSRFGWRAAVGELIAGIAHHLNNPVGALASTLRRLENNLASVEDAEVRAPLVRLVQRSREIAVRIESNVNSVVRAHEAGAPDPTRHWLLLHHEIETALSMFADRLEHVHLVRDYREDPPVQVPHDSLHLVLSNLIDNSLRSMQEQGTLTISVRPRGGELAVQICDSGGGVPAAVLPRLFEPILSARAGGAGLGLSTAQRLARAWGGDLVHLPAAGGCTFEVRIPMPTASSSDASQPLPRLQQAPPPAPASQLTGMAMAPAEYQRSRAAPQESKEDPS